MWGLVGKGLLGLVKFPFKNKLLTAGAATAAYWNRDALEEKKDEIVEQYNREGLAKTASDLGNDVVEGASSALDKTTETIDLAKEIVEDPVEFTDKKAREAFERMSNPDSKENKNENGSMFSAIGKLLQGDFAGAASAFTGEDGFGFGDGAKLGGVAAVMFGIFKLFGGGKDDNDSGFDLINGTTITIGLAALAFMNRDFIMDKVNDFTGGSDRDRTNNPFNTVEVDTLEI